MVSSVTLSALVFALALATPLTWAGPLYDNFEEQDPAHSVHIIGPKRDTKVNPDELDPNFWINGAKNLLKAKLKAKPIKHKAKNVIMFLGDGLSVPTLAAARMFIGGEEKVLSFEEFPFTGLSKTYCCNSQVADSACSATAYLCGVKGNIYTIGLTCAANYGSCSGQTNVSNHVSSIVQWSQDAGKSTGIVTNTRITDASPAGAYCHIADRNWQYQATAPCVDCARQLVENIPGKNIKVILGGGRSYFLPTNVRDCENIYGRRTDGRNLINTWTTDKQQRNVTYKYVCNRNELRNITPCSTEYTLGLFNTDDMQYNCERNVTKEPSLAEMTEYAILSLQKDPNGFFLFVEGGLIDKAHHENKANKSLNETEEFSKAVQVAVNLTNEEDTLIVVTADHAHVMTYSGYAVRGNPICGKAGNGSDNRPYATLSYANGPSYSTYYGTCPRRNITNDNLCTCNYQYPAGVPLSSETHGGDDVAVFARGPWAHLFSGTYEQNYIPHAMAYASCVTPQFGCQ